jgi:hypothetical protein
MFDKESTMTVSKKYTLNAIIITVGLFMFGCGGKGGGGTAATAADKDTSQISFAISDDDIPSDYPPCTFNGVNYQHGDSVIAYQNSSVAYGSSCVSETRLCEYGVLSGSYQYGSCSVGQAASCLFNGQTIAHGQSVQAYANSTVNFGSTCSAQTRTCNNGVLSGSNQYASCSVNQPASCLFNGQTIAHGQSVNAFQTSSVSYGSLCTIEQRTCNNGALSGSYSYSSCAVDQPASCIFNGQTVAHGQVVTAFQNSSVGFGSSCQSEQRMCDNGVMSGSYQYGSCNVDQPASCLFDGQTIAHGQSVQAYPTSSVGFDAFCISETRTCSNGVLSGSNQYSSCSKNSPASCLFNGQTIAHGEYVFAFKSSNVAYGQTCEAEERSCYNGTLDGENQYASCTVDSGASCLINGQTIAHGQTTTFFKNSVEAYGSSCQSEVRTCDNGSASGSYENTSCVVQSPRSCEFNGQVIEHGATVTAYQSSSVANGSTCQSEVRSCQDGVLSGSYANNACTVAPPPAPEDPCKTKTHSDNGNHYGWYIWGHNHSDNGWHYGWYKYKYGKECKPPKPPKHPCKRKHEHKHKKDKDDCDKKKEPVKKDDKKKDDAKKK